MANPSSEARGSEARGSDLKSQGPMHSATTFLLAGERLLRAHCRLRNAEFDRLHPTFCRHLPRFRQTHRADSCFLARASDPVPICARAGRSLPPPRPLQMLEVLKQPGPHAHHQRVLPLLGLGQFLVQQVLASEIVGQAL